MTLDLFLLIIVVITALAFDFTNGFHDTGNAMATSIASGALAPKAAVALSAALNLVGAFLSTAVAATIAKGLVDSHLVTLELVFAGLVGGIVWNLLTWLLGIPSSSSHALIGGIVGAMIAAVGGHGVIWSGLVSKVIIPAVVAAVLATLVGAVGTWLVYRVTRGVPEQRSEQGFRRGQIGSAALVSLAHGTNDAQKTMGVIFLALMSYGAVSKTSTLPPLWVIVCCAAAIAAGTYFGGWRIIRTMGKGLVEIKPPQGMAAESSSAAVILLSANFGYALSTTQVATGSVLGSGVGKPGAEVRWGVAGRMMTAWLITLPAAGTVGAITYGVVHAIGGYAGVTVGFALLAAISLAIWLQARKVRIDHTNVNREWEGSLTAGLDEADEPAPTRAAATLTARVASPPDDDTVPAPSAPAS
ncbi:inorganic phosphate transporter [Mycobacterium xenopi]|uniref:Phosphate transporter n=2 Tax=Mycobacterium xenopi TaxID=1789 RepID=A0AAD1H3U8_MYCXE|nr:inorganic phosphate transporter [Mycobacterium xenopi]MDA3639507.1 inorganic phosphate transporter [Mycobacterium xenopi]MDA3657744.1 inorganic phosphate transporter [Mycobacterium xenopi]MDA3663020.1 inorganic phosphate transporter [Mycobacterium xenopi]ORX20361.1 inorganic phosphate transporter [Mycobacterium xenopi]SPX90329.1 inorganic phosphate transporter [Mycobacterium xenopi]